MADVDPQLWFAAECYFPMSPCASCNHPLSAHWSVVPPRCLFKRPDGVACTCTKMEYQQEVYDKYYQLVAKEVGKALIDGKENDEDGGEVLFYLKRGGILPGRTIHFDDLVSLPIYTITVRQALSDVWSVWGRESSKLRQYINRKLTTVVDLSGRVLVDCTAEALSYVFSQSSKIHGVTRTRFVGSKVPVTKDAVRSELEKLAKVRAQSYEHSPHFVGRLDQIVIAHEAYMNPTPIHVALSYSSGSVANAPAQQYLEVAGQMTEVFHPFDTEVIPYGTPPLNCYVVVPDRLPRYRLAVLGE